MGQHNREQTVWKNAPQVACDAGAKVVHRGRLVFQQRTKELFANFFAKCKELRATCQSYLGTLNSKKLKF